MNKLGNSPPGSPGCPVRARTLSSGTVLAGKDSLRRGTKRRALAPCAPFRCATLRDGRLRREQHIQRFLGLTKSQNQVVVDTTS